MLLITLTSRIVSGNIGQKRQFFIPLPFNLHDHVDPLRIYFNNFNTNYASPKAKTVQNIAEKSNYVSTVHHRRSRYRRQTTDVRQTTYGIAMTRRT